MELTVFAYQECWRDTKGGCITSILLYKLLGSAPSCSGVAIAVFWQMGIKCFGCSASVTNPCSLPWHYINSYLQSMMSFCCWELIQDWNTVLSTTDSLQDDVHYVLYTPWVAGGNSNLPATLLVIIVLYSQIHFIQIEDLFLAFLLKLFVLQNISKIFHLTNRQEMLPSVCHSSVLITDFLLSSFAGYMLRKAVLDARMKCFGSQWIRE